MTVASYNKLRKSRAEGNAPQSDTPRVRTFKNCPRCGAPLKKAISYEGTESAFWLRCSVKGCETYVNTYIPQEHQYAFHKDSHRFKGNFGGYGTGKTTTDREEFYKHLLITPNGNGLIGANIMAQYEGTIKRDIESDIPAEFVAGVSLQKSYMDFVNGYRLMYRPYDDADKLRSLNLDFWLILEASEVKTEAYIQLKSRIRNTAASKQAYDEEGNPLWRLTKTGVQVPILAADWRQGIVESNPDAGWIKTDHLQHSSLIKTYGSVKDNIRVNPAEQDRAISSHIVASDQNEFLPPNFIDDLKRNKPLWWIARYIEGSFAYSEGLVYPRAADCVCETFAPPRTWKRVMAHDYGLVDPSVFLFGAIDEAEGVLYIYKEVRATERNIKELAELCKQASKDIPAGGYAFTPKIDPKSGVKRDYEKKTLISYYADYGVLFEPGVVNVDARIFKTNTYLESGYVKIMNCCTALIKELSDYKFKSNGLNSTELSDKPEDKNNHSINCLEWIIMDLPANPKEILYGVYNRRGVNIAQEIEQRERKASYWALSDDEEPYNSMYYNSGGLY